MNPSVLAFEAWDAGSHRAIRESISRHGRLDWAFVTMAGRSPRWRLRHASLRFAERIRTEPVGGEDLRSHQDPDAIFATGMLSLADLRAGLPPKLRNLPFILSMHENQAAYPVSGAVGDSTRDRDDHLAFTNLASIEAADRVVWNSRWNLESFIEGMSGILRHSPEPLGDQWIQRLEAKSTVVPPPIEAIEIESAKALHNPGRMGYPDAAGAERRVLHVAWPHRWEHDKGCEEFLEIADEAARREEAGGPVIRWVILGRETPAAPAAMKELLTRHADRIAHAGGLDRPRYLAWLARCDWVLSTARHEFFGMAVAEALLAGCLPWLPSRLAYPELVPEDALGINPWSVESGRNSAGLRSRIQSRLKRAHASVAVPALEAVIQEAIEASRGRS
mgnify:CR=1 FL=1